VHNISSSSSFALQVTEFLDESTLGLLFGMMILVGKLKDTGLFEVLCAATLRASRGKMWLLSVLMMYITGEHVLQMTMHVAVLVCMLGCVGARCGCSACS
jgi:Na+/H+ antiporter NhaD/arsenite permease-like protein